MIKLSFFLFFIFVFKVQAQLEPTPQRRVFIQHLKFQQFINHWSDEAEENYYYGAEGEVKVILYTRDDMSEVFDLVLKENEFSQIDNHHHFQIKGEYSVLDFDHSEPLDYFLLDEEAKIASFEVWVRLKKVNVISKKKILAQTETLTLKFNDEDNKEAFNELLKNLEPDQVITNQELKITVENVDTQCQLTPEEASYLLHKNQNEDLEIIWGC